MRAKAQEHHEVKASREAQEKEQLAMEIESRKATYEAERRLREAARVNLLSKLAEEREVLAKEMSVEEREKRDRLAAVELAYASGDMSSSSSSSKNGNEEKKRTSRATNMASEMLFRY